MAAATRGAGAESSRRRRWRLARSSEEEEDAVWRLGLGQHGCRARWVEGAAGAVVGGRPRAEMEML